MKYRNQHPHNLLPHLSLTSQGRTIKANDYGAPGLSMDIMASDAFTFKTASIKVWGGLETSLVPRLGDEATGDEAPCLMCALLEIGSYSRTTMCQYWDNCLIY